FGKYIYLIEFKRSTYNFLRFFNNRNVSTTFNRFFPDSHTNLERLLVSDKHQFLVLSIIQPLLKTSNNKFLYNKQQLLDLLAELKFYLLTLQWVKKPLLEYDCFHTLSEDGHLIIVFLQYSNVDPILQVRCCQFLDLSLKILV